MCILLSLSFQMKDTIKTLEEKQKQLEERLQVSLLQIKNHGEVNATIKSLFFHLHKAISTVSTIIHCSLV